MGIANIVFILLLSAAIFWFYTSARKIARNIRLGVDEDRSDNAAMRWKTMLLVALGQSKMLTRPIAAILHLFVYVGFVLINLEVMEMFIDGVFGSHRFFSSFGSFYDFLIGFFEVLAFLVTFGCVIFLIRRNVIRIKRFMGNEMTGWPKSDANIILVTEILLMSALFTMNAADQVLQSMGSNHYVIAGSFPVSSFLVPFLSGLSESTLIIVERA